MLKEGDREVEKFRAKTKEENLAKDLLVSRLKVQPTGFPHKPYQDAFWESQQEQSVIVKAFQKRYSVANYPLRVRSRAEDLQRKQILALRGAEIMEFKMNQVQPM